MNQKLTPPSPERQALVTEWARQINSGEFYAGYWNWYSNDVLIGSLPAFRLGNVYRYEPSPHHPHYAIFMEWEAHKKSGAVDRGEYVLQTRISGQSCEYKTAEQSVGWHVQNTYIIQKTDKHPDNCKPKLKMLDWSNVPVGTMTDRGEILFIVPPAFATVRSKMRIDVVALSALSIIPATKWTAVQDGEKPPVCDGLVIELRMTGGNTINAYRVIGLADGYTDVPEESVWPTQQ